MKYPKQIKPRRADEDPADGARPWICPICRKVGMTRGRSMFKWLDPTLGTMRKALVCVECAPQYAPDDGDGLSVRQRTKKH